jgi:hypothetical protein
MLAWVLGWGECPWATGRKGLVSFDTGLVQYLIDDQGRAAPSLDNCQSPTTHTMFSRDLSQASLEEIVRTLRLMLWNFWLLWKPLRCHLQAGGNISLNSRKGWTTWPL